MLESERFGHSGISDSLLEAVIKIQTEVKDYPREETRYGKKKNKTKTHRKVVQAPECSQP